MNWASGTTATDWVQAASGLVVALAVIFAAGRYLFSFSVPLIAELTDNTSGQSYIDGKQVSDHYGWTCFLRNNSNLPAHVAQIKLQRKRLWWFWASVKDGQYPRSNVLPTSIAPMTALEVWLFREKKDRGTYRLLVKEYGSLRSCAVPLVEIGRV